MSRLSFFLATLFLMGTLPACEEKQEKSEGLYSYTVKGCATGEQKYGSHDELCSKLRDDRLNNGCARAQRRERYQNDCGQDFDGTPAARQPNPAPESSETKESADDSKLSQDGIWPCDFQKLDGMTQEEACSALKNRTVDFGETCPDGAISNYYYFTQRCD